MFNFFKLFVMQFVNLPDNRLRDLAQQIKPLMRVPAELADKCGVPEGTLVFVHPVNVKKSFYNNFDAKSIVRDEKDGKSLPVIGLEEVGSFICYHRCWSFNFEATVAEVLSQIPLSVRLQDVDAFEIRFASKGVYDGTVYDPVAGCHFSTVILYHLDGGLPKEISDQPVFLDNY